MLENQKSYRKDIAKSFKTFEIVYKDTDIFLAYSGKIKESIIKPQGEKFIRKLRQKIESYPQREFFSSLIPINIQLNDPKYILELKRASIIAKVGPMAGIAGFFAKELGKYLKNTFSLKDIIVENGGDIYADCQKSINVKLPTFSSCKNVFLKIDSFPVGICTSSGKIGHSLSFGRADFVSISCKCPILADNYATYYGNKIKSKEDLKYITNSLDKKILSFIAYIDEFYVVKSNFEIKFR